MMADLVDEDMGDDIAQGFLVLGPVVENGTAIKRDAVHHLTRFHGETFGDAASFEQSEKIEGCFERHVFEHVIGRKIGDLDDEIFRQRAKFFRQVAICLDRKRLEGGKCRRMAVPPIVGLVYAGHFCSLLEGPYKHLLDKFRDPTASPAENA